MEFIKRLANNLFGKRKTYDAKELGIFYSKVWNCWKNESYYWFTSMKFSVYRERPVHRHEKNGFRPWVPSHLQLSFRIRQRSNIVDIFCRQFCVDRIFMFPARHFFYISLIYYVFFSISLHPAPDVLSVRNPSTVFATEGKTLLHQSVMYSMYQERNYNVPR